MKIEILPDDVFWMIRETEPAMVQDRNKYSYSRWSGARVALLETLSEYGNVDVDEVGDGDFYVGSDWLETGALHVVFFSFESLTSELLVECHGFLSSQYGDFLIAVSQSMPTVGDVFELVITAKRSYVEFFRKTDVETRAILTNDIRFAAISRLLA